MTRMILTEEQLKERKDKARKEEIRQNVKSHCTKIRDGIRANGSTSGERAIWELFQNARDLSDSAEIKMTLTDKEFIFAHKGKAFTYDSLCSLVKQVSSHEKEDNNSVGQYGTGFLTTHKFSRKITINGSMLISEEPTVYVDVTSFEINRENFNDIPKFIDDMTDQIESVEKLMDTEQKSTPKDWTELHYELNEERHNIADKAIEEAIRMMPYVLTFNDNVSRCTICSKEQVIEFKKEDKATSIDNLRCKRITKSTNGDAIAINCFYLELHNGESRILLPLQTETEVCSLGDIPRLFVHFPLIGSNYFNVNFLFHSHRFTPEEKRDNIIVPKNNDANESIVQDNKKILNEMTQYLWNFLEMHVETWDKTILMANIDIKDSGFTEKETEKYYKDLKEEWVTEFKKLKLIEIDGTRYCMDEAKHPVVLEPSLEQFLSNNDSEYLNTIYPYAKGAKLVSYKEEILQWSKIIGIWDSEKKENFLTLEDIVKFVSEHKGENLLNMLEILIAAGATQFFEEYELIPNREGELRKQRDLRDARAIPPKLYGLVQAVEPSICKKMVDTKFQNIIKLNPYTRQNLREELNDIVGEKENACWKNSVTPQPYGGDFERSIIYLCSAFTTQNGDSKRNKLMPIIYRFEGIKDYEDIYIPADEEDQNGFDLYRQVFKSLVENQMMKISKKNKMWIEENIKDLVDFVDYARGDDYKTFCTQYAIYPDMNGFLHKPDELKKNINVNTKLFELYTDVIGEDLKNKCVDSRFADFFSKYNEETYQFTPESVAKEIQNKLSSSQYDNIILLDIIELTEQKGTEGEQWRRLFKDIYDQRESIRYKLGTDEERKAINRMMKQKKPELLTKMADVSERSDADTVLNKINEAINAYEHEQYIKMLGDYVEKNVQRLIEEALKDTNISVKNEQGGQDLILSKDGFEPYHIEIKSRWINKEQAIMSTLQFQTAVEHPMRYSLISAQMWNFDKKRVENEECLKIEEMEQLLKVCDDIGLLEADLKKRVDAAFKGGEEDIRINGNYDVRIPQKVFKLDFDKLISLIKKKFDNH
jgi:hypothetical protein